MRWLRWLLVVVVMVGSASLWAADGDLPGSGTEGDPYLIEDFLDFVTFCGDTNYWDDYTRLDCDLNLSMAGSYTQAPIAGNTHAGLDFNGVAFTGSFNGNDHIISNLTVDGSYYCGLFGETSGTAVIEKLSIEECDIGGFDQVACLVGKNYGSISNCYSSGEVTGYDYVGGLAGENYGSITSSYSTGSVMGGWNVGGLVGLNESIMSSCFFAGIITGNGQVGSLVGQQHGDRNGITSNCYFYIYSGPNNGYGTALDDEQLQDKDSFVGFDFAGDTSDGAEDNWAIESGYMPRLTWQASPGYAPPYHFDNITTTLSGSGSCDDPFIISNYDDLIEFRTNSDLRFGYYSLTSNINLAGVIYPDGFIPEYFNGSLNGNGHTISNLTIDGYGYQGFFRKLSGFVSNLTMEDISVSGHSNGVGGLVGINQGSIINCHSTGAVVGDGYRKTGGLVGSNNHGVLTNCSSTVEVMATGDYVGGLIGGDDEGFITNCYSTGNVTGNNHVGGLLGSLDGRIANSYSTGTVTSPGNVVGGLVGGKDHGDYRNHVSNSYFLATSGPDNGYGLPLTDAQMQQQSSFAVWDFVGQTTDGSSQVWQMPQGGSGYPELSVPNGVAPVQLSGAGCESNPYLIGSALELGAIIHYNPSAHYKLTNNIDLSSIKWSTPVILPFSGEFNGNGMKIIGLKIENSGYAGLFGVIRRGGLVKNIGLENCDVSGHEVVGSLAASSNHSSIMNCYSTGKVMGLGSEARAGFLVSDNDRSSITNCYATGSVYSDWLAGGLVFINMHGNITNCYWSGSISSDAGLGGCLAGANYNGSFNNCFWDAETSNSNVAYYVFDFEDDPNFVFDPIYSTPGVAEGKTTAHMQTQSTFTVAGWDFDPDDGDAADWMMLREGEDYPRLAWQEVYVGDIAGLYGVDAVDFAYLAVYWGLHACDGADDCGRADIDASGDVTLSDLVAVVEDWALH